MPKPETVSAYYRSYYSFQDRAAPKITFYKPERLAQHILALAGGPRSKPISRILDFGGGDATLSKLVAKIAIAGNRSIQPIVIDLVDYSKPEETLSTEAVSVRHHDSLMSVELGSYDVVLASSVVEHIPNPRPDLESLFAAMAPGGFFYARTPWIAPLIKAMSSMAKRFDFTYPAHVHDLGKAFWEGLPRILDLNPREFQLAHSRPSIVETGFEEAPLRTLVAYIMKFPWLFFRGYDLVGGWEVVFKRSPA